MKFYGWLLLTGLVSASASVQAERADFNRFANLFEREKNIQESIRKYQNLEDLRGKAQLSLESLMKRNPGNTEIEMRYAELILQRARDLELLSLEFVAGGNPTQGQKVKIFSRELAEKGLRLHAKILARTGKHPLMGKIYLAMGRTELALGNKTQALHSAELGLAAAQRQTVDATTILHLWILRADVAFDLNKLGIALESYNKAQPLAVDGSLERAYVLYRLAWVQYNLKDPNQALALLDKLVTVTKDKFALRQESIQDYGLFSADLSPKDFERRGGIEGIFKHIRELASDDAEALSSLETMAAMISKNGRREVAVKTYEFLIDRNPMAIENLARALTIVEISHKFADKSKLADRYVWLLNEYGPGSRWFVSHKLSTELQKTAANDVDAVLRKYAIGLHKEASEEKLPALKLKQENVALRLYEAHMQAFPEVPQIHFYAAELYRERNEFVKAGTNYDQFLRLISLAKQDEISAADRKNRNEAGLSAVEMWAKAVEKDKKHASSLIAAIDAFVRYFPNHPKAAKTLIAAAKVEVAAGHSASALIRLESIVKKYPKSPEAAESVHASLDLLNKESDFTNLAVKARAWLNTLTVWAPSATQAKLRAELTLILSKSEAKGCDNMSKENGKEMEAALCLQAYARTFPRDPVVPKMLLLSAELMEKAKDHNGSLTTLESLVRNFPQSEQSTAALSRLAANYEKTFQFDRAAGAYEALAPRTSVVADRERIQKRLVSILAGLGLEQRLHAQLTKQGTPASLKKEYSERIQHEQFATLKNEEIQFGYRPGRLASERGQQLLQTLAKRHDLTAEQRIEISRIRGAAAFAAGHVAQAQKEWSNARRLFATAPKNQALNDAAARLRLQEISILEAQFAHLNVKKQLKAKVALLQKLDNAYAEILRMNSPSTALGAIGKSSRIYATLANDLKRNGASFAQVQSFQGRAQEIAQVLAQKAQEWKIISPSVIAAFKSADMGGANFPWNDLPRWLDLNEAQSDWSEWSWKYTSLEDAARKNQGEESRRAAFVLLTRKNDTRDSLVASWVPTFTDRAGIQARTQAVLFEGHIGLAGLYLTQYESLFGVDAFSEHLWGRLDWARGDYHAAYTRWTHSRFTQDFRAAYWAQGWLALSDSFASASKSNARRAIVFEKLSTLAKDNWQEHYLAALCAMNAMDCRGDYVSSNLLRVLDSRSDAPFRFEFADRRSDWQTKRNAYIYVIQNALLNARQTEDLNLAKTALSDLGNLKKYAIRPNELEEDILALGRRLDQRQSEIEIADRAAKQKRVAEAGVKK